MMVQRFLVLKFMDKNFNGCFRNTLAACFALCFAFASEFGMLVVQLFSWMCMMFLTIGLTRFSTTN